jgi:hypothetical protein
MIYKPFSSHVLAPSHTIPITAQAVDFFCLKVKLCDYTQVWGCCTKYSEQLRSSRPHLHPLHVHTSSEDISSKTGADIAIQWTLVNPALVNPVLGLSRSKTQGTNHSEPD